MFYKRYEKSDFIRDAVFENTLTENATALGRGGKQLEADHSKLDKYLAEELPTDTIERKESATRSIYRRVSNVGARATGAIRTSSRGSRDASGQFRKRTRSEDGEDSFNNSRCSTSSVSSILGRRGSGSPVRSQTAPRAVGFRRGSAARGSLDGPPQRSMTNAPAARAGVHVV